MTLGPIPITAAPASIGGLPLADYSPYQQKIIKRYYENFDAIKHQRLAELVTELYLAEGKKKDRYWKQVQEILESLELPKSRLDHILEKRDPALLTSVLEELGRKKGL